MACHLGADGQYRELLHYPYGVSHHLDLVGTEAGNIIMKGNEVFKVPVTTLGNVAAETLEKAGIAKEELDWLVPHQANKRINEFVGQKLEIDPDKIVHNIQKYGNTTAASIPLALSEAIQEGRAKKGDLILLPAFGSGFTWGAALVRL